ncbi:MAG: SCO4225 family membrane protein [Actinomycetota bacterium]
MAHRRHHPRRTGTSPPTTTGPVRKPHSYVTPASFAGIWLVPVTAPWSLIVVFFLPEWPRPFFDLFFFAAAGVNTLLIGALEHRLRTRRDNR